MTISIQAKVRILGNTGRKKTDELAVKKKVFILNLNFDIQRIPQVVLC